MKTTITTTTGNRITLENLGDDAVFTVHDRDGQVLERWEGEIPTGLASLVRSATFRLVRSCEVCGSSFRAKRATAHTCSAACRTKRWRARRAS